MMETTQGHINSFCHFITLMKQRENLEQVRRRGKMMTEERRRV